jgi:hypothetical protein
VSEPAGKGRRDFLRKGAALALVPRISAVPPAPFRLAICNETFEGWSFPEACRGARAAGGRTIGILPGSERTEANPFVDVAVVTGMGQARNVLIVLSCDALIAIGGGFGTLSEIALALRHGKPVVGLRTWEAVRGGRAAPVVSVQSADDAVREALRLAGEGR